MAIEEASLPADTRLRGALERIQGTRSTGSVTLALVRQE
jgi:hypothetical protein